MHVTDISCGVVYKATLASLVLFRSYCYVVIKGNVSGYLKVAEKFNFVCENVALDLH